MGRNVCVGVSVGTIGCVGVDVGGIGGDVGWTGPAVGAIRAIVDVGETCLTISVPGTAGRSEEGSRDTVREPNAARSAAVASTMLAAERVEYGRGPRGGMGVDDPLRRVARDLDVGWRIRKIHTTAEDWGQIHNPKNGFAS